jgi:hypothetical protein
MADRKIFYAASADVTITLAALAASSTLVAGRESATVDNSLNLYLDYLLSGKVTTGTAPTAGIIEVWVVAELDDTTWPDVFDGTESAETVTTRDILTSCARLAASMTTDATANRTYPFAKISVASLFGGVCPRKFVVFVTHSTVAALNATAGNHDVNVQGVYETVL